jgi:predicted transcriptional regulator
VVVAVAIRMTIERRMKSKDIIELGLGSIGKVRIMRALAEEDKMATIYGIHKKTRLKREDIKRNLDDLMKIGWVKENKLANIMYSINRENEYVNHLISFFVDVGYIGGGGEE